MKRTYTTEKRAEARELLTFDEVNKKGEKIQIEFTRCRVPDATSIKNSIPYLWYKAGYIDRILTSYWSVTVYATDTEGNCWGRYNPTEKKGKINFDWMLEATEENKQKLIKKIEKLAFS